jgi:PEGA domain-containing protein
MRISDKCKGLVVVGFLLLFVAGAWAQKPVTGKIKFVAANKAAKTSGVWIDGQYVGYLNELKEERSVSLLPGEHEIAVRQSGYQDFVQNVIVEPGRQLVLKVVIQKDPRARLPKLTAKIKLQVNPDRAAVFVDDAYVGHVEEFGRGMLVGSGKHHIKITLPGYQTFDTEVNLLPDQDFTIKTELLKGSITQADPLLKKPS